MSVTKRKRRDPHAGRARGVQNHKTGNSGGPSASLTEGEKVRMGAGIFASFAEIGSVKH